MKYLALAISIIAFSFAFFAPKYYTYNGDNCQQVWEEVISEKQSVVIIDCRV